MIGLTKFSSKKKYFYTPDPRVRVHNAVNGVGEGIRAHVCVLMDY